MKLLNFVAACIITTLLVLLVTPYTSIYDENSYFGNRHWTNYTTRIAFKYYYPFKPVNETRDYSNLDNPKYYVIGAYTYRLSWEIIIPSSVVLIVFLYIILNKTRLRKIKNKYAT